MLTAPLPKGVDIRKLAHQQQEIRGHIAVSELPRLVTLLANDHGDIQVELQFGQDEQRRYVVEGRLTGTLQILCQRCLQPMPYPFEADLSLGVVRDEDEAKQLPRALDPLIVEDDLLELAPMVEDELILCVPFTAYHPESECGQVQEEHIGSESGSESANPENPFKVLEQLKSSR